MSGDIIETGASNSYDLAVARAPKQVLAEAKEAAMALREVISQKQKPVIFNGEQYLEFEDWMTVAKFYGITAKVVSTEYVDIGGAKGFMARAEALLINTGMVISAAESMCMNDEDKWTSRAKYEYVNGTRTKTGEVPVPMFQLRSMAQTRACAKALRNVLAWVVVLAGYKATPAEEMTGTEGGNNNTAPAKQTQPMPARKSEAGATPVAKSYTGIVTKHYAPKGQSKYHSFTLDTHPQYYLQTADEMIIETMIGHGKTKDTLTIDVLESVTPDGKYTNRRITGISVQQGDAQEPEKAETKQ